LGETVTAVRLGDPSRIAFGSDGVLCPSSSSPEGEHSCSATGANVIFFRQIQDALGKGIPFPYLTSSADGSTQATIFTNGPKGQRMYPVLLNLGGSKPPSYTTVALKPEEDKPQPHNIALPVRPEPQPGKFPQPPGNNIQQPVVPPSDPTLKTATIPTDVQSEDFAFHPDRREQRGRGAEEQRGGIVGQTKSFPLCPPSQELLCQSLPTTYDHTRVNPSPPAPSAQSVDDVTTFAFGLLEAIQSGRIKSDTLVWKQAQTALSWLRRGESIDYALNRSQLSRLSFNFFLALGQQESPLTKLNIPQNSKTPTQSAPSSTTPPSTSSDFSSTQPQFDPVVLSPQTSPINNNLTQFQSPQSQCSSLNDAKAVGLGLLLAKQSGKIAPHAPKWNQVQKVVARLQQGASRTNALLDSELDPSELSRLLKAGRDRLNTFKE